MEPNKIDELIDLGTWLGRRQTFGVIAGRCSAAEAKCLREVREARKYRDYGLTWREFCTRHVGLSRGMADKIIRQLDEFGEAYFHLAGVTRITPEHYRLIAGAVSEDGLEYEGEKIAIDPTNAARLSKAVEKLIDSQPSRNEPSPLEDRLQKLNQRLTTALEELERLTTEELEIPARLRLHTFIGSHSDRLNQLRQRV